MRNIVTDHIQKKEVWMHASCYILKETVAFLWKYTITYMDDSGEEHKEEMELSTEILQPVEDLEDAKEEQTAGQWWISILVAFAIIAIVVSVIIVTKFSRMMKMK